MNILRPLAIVFLLVAAVMTGACATAKPTIPEKDQESILREQQARWEGQVKAWGVEYAHALDEYQAAESAPDIAKAVGIMKQLAESAPSRAAKERATQDVCGAAAAAGDAAILTTFDCIAREPLRRLLR